MADSIVPKVTAFDETAALWAVMSGETARARETVNSMLPGELAEFEAHLSALMDMIWSRT